MDTLLLAAVKAPLVPQLLLLPFWPVKILYPSRALTAGAKEKFLRESFFYYFMYVCMYIFLFY
jgi:hypothetical protein